MQSLDLAKLPLRVLCRQLASMPAQAFAQLTQADLDVVRARTGQAWPVRLGGRVWQAGAGLGVLAMVAAWVALVLLAPETGPLGSAFVVLLAMSMIGLFIGLSLAACVLGFAGSGSLRSARDSLVPLSQIPGACADALDTLDSPSARAHRDAVLDQGRELCYQDLTHMRRLKRADEDQSWAQRHARECRQLHVSLG